MKVFQCQSCGQLLYFENTRCERCERALGYLPTACSLTALEPLGDGSWTALAEPQGGAVRYCGNQLHQACNWLLPADSTDLLCLACRLNRTIPTSTTRSNWACGARSKRSSDGLFTASCAWGCRW